MLWNWTSFHDRSCIYQTRSLVLSHITFINLVWVFKTTTKKFFIINHSYYKTLHTENNLRVKQENSWNLQNWLSPFSLQQPCYLLLRDLMSCGVTERLQWNHTFLFDLNILVNKADFQNKSNGHNKTRKPGCHWMSHGMMFCNKFLKFKTLTF